MFPQKCNWPKFLHLFVVGILLCCGFTIPSQAYAAEASPRIAYVIGRGGGFWKYSREFTQEVAKDLGVDVEFHVAPSSFKALQTIEKICSRKNPPDYIVSIYATNAGPRIIKLANQAQIPIFIFGANMRDGDEKLIGKPREKVPYWLGHMYPDDKKLGFILAGYLADIASQKIAVDKTSARHEMVAVLGEKDMTVTKHRLTGLRQKVLSSPKIDLKRHVYSDWSSGDGEAKTYGLLQYYANISMIWTANDELARGAVRGVKRMGFKPGKDIFIGGIDWDKESIELVENGEIAVTIGGHYMDGGWILIMLLDHFHGIDFHEDVGTVMNSPFITIQKDNVGKYRRFIIDNEWDRVDFKGFSKYFSPGLERYNFSIENITRKSSDEENL